MRWLEERHSLGSGLTETPMDRRSWSTWMVIAAEFTAASVRSRLARTVDVLWLPDRLKRMLVNNSIIGIGAVQTLGQ